MEAWEPGQPYHPLNWGDFVPTLFIRADAGPVSDPYYYAPWKTMYQRFVTYQYRYYPEGLQYVYFVDSQNFLPPPYDHWSPLNYTRPQPTSGIGYLEGHLGETFVKQYDNIYILADVSVAPRVGGMTNMMASLLLLGIWFETPLNIGRLPKR